MSELKRAMIHIDGEPPKTTAQTKKVSVIRGRPVFYEPQKLREARRYLTDALLAHRPATVPFEGTIKLNVVWAFRATGKNKPGHFKATRPDTDNLQKLLKDCMTSAGYWKDDAQVAVETASKIWTTEPCIHIHVEEIDSQITEQKEKETP